MDSDYEAEEIVFGFLRTIVHEYCGLNNIADIKRMFTIYVDLVNLVCSHYLSPGWSEEEFDTLFLKIRLFKVIESQNSENYQPSKREHKNGTH